MTVMTVAAVRAGRAGRETPTHDAAITSPRSAEQSAPSGRRGLSGRLAGSTVAVLIALHVTAVFAAGPQSYTRCMGWPLWRLVDGDLHPWLQVSRLVLAGVAAVLVVATAAVTLRCELRPWGVAIAALFGVEMVLGLVLTGGTGSLGVAVAYSVTAVALLWVLAVVTAAGTRRTGGRVVSRTALPTAVG
jgi:cytochrome c oxidase assembly protein subunit 15